MITITSSEAAYHTALQISCAPVLWVGPYGVIMARLGSQEYIGGGLRDSQYQLPKWITAILRQALIPGGIGIYPRAQADPPRETCGDQDLPSLQAAAATMGRKGGRAKSDIKTMAVRENGTRGGRPKKGGS